jgi:4'-phosphopantetheinyl transferase
MLRTCLSAYLDRRPADWAFAVNAYGRPHIEGRHAGEVHFNLSHTAGFVTCAIARTYDIGVDVERTDRDVDHLQLAPSVFAHLELEHLGMAPSGDRAATFFRLWTLKEAYIKARGMGLSIPLKDFWFDVSTYPARIGFSPALRDDPDAWRFWEFDVAPACRLALAGRLGGRAAQVELIEMTSVRA